MRTVLKLAFVLLLSGCAVLAVSEFNERWGIPNPARYDAPDQHTAASGLDYQHDIQPVLERRCIVCHACYDAPCQLKMESFSGLSRGANKDLVYDGERLIAANLTRLHEDAQTNPEWRAKGFFPVLNERDNTAAANINGSVMAQMLLLKADHPLPTQAILPDSFDFRLSRDQQCTSIESFENYKADYPLWGMPYGLPGLNTTEQNMLMQWIAQGAPHQAPSPIPEPLQQKLAQWESFWNQDSLKAQLMSRYMYEHLYLAHLYFEENSTPLFFRLVRSATPPGQPLQRISTRRPFDDPGVQRVYYRLIVEPEVVVAKTHMPYRLDAARMQNWKKLFLDASYNVTKLPSYTPEEASNPFITFDQIPSLARYRFMLEESQYTIMGFIKGAVCRGQIALNVINDYFWVVFTDPSLQSADNDTHLLGKALLDISLPAEAESTSSPLRWIKYANQERQYLKAESEFMNQNLSTRIPLDLNLLWKGDGKNDNAALTIFRHSDSATVIKGLQGTAPQTAWIITYPLLERIHYLLVAGYDVYGNVGHQLNSRIYMDFLRMEGEFHFLALLPQAEREAVRRHWYRGSVSTVKEYIYKDGNQFDGETDVIYQSENHLQELYDNVKKYVKPVLNEDHHLGKGFTDAPTLAALNALNGITGIAASILPQTAFVAVESSKTGITHYYTLIHNNAYTNISELFGEQDRHLPEEDVLSVAYGFIGAYPSALLRVQQAQLPEFAQQVAQLKNETDYQHLLDRFGIRRTNPDFWPFSDAMHQAYREALPIEAGWFDFNRLENR